MDLTEQLSTLVENVRKGIPMWADLKAGFSHPARRRLWLTIVSGILIVGGLLARHGSDNIDLWSAALVAAALLAGADIAVRAVQALRLRHFGIEPLVTVAATGALLIGEYWEAAAVTFLFILGSWLEARTMRQTRGALMALIEVAASAVASGETVLVKAGQRIPVDGEVINGTRAPQGFRHSCARLPSASM